jgi:hypothetical protein
LRLLLSNYFAGTPDELHLEALDRLPDVVTVLNSGRIMPAGDPARPAMLSTFFPPHCDVMQLYRSSTRKIVYLVRDPRDVLLSSIPYLGVPAAHAADFARRFISNRGAPQWTAGWGTWLSNVRDWTDTDNLSRCFPDAELMVVRYEDLRAETVRTLSGMLGFLDAGPVDAGRVHSAVDFSSLENVRAAQPAPGQPDDGEGARHGGVRQHRSLALLGEDIEAAYRQTVQDDSALAGCLHRHGYELSVPAGRA